MEVPGDLEGHPVEHQVSGPHAAGQILPAGSLPSRRWRSGAGILLRKWPAPWPRLLRVNARHPPWCGVRRGGQLASFTGCWKVAACLPTGLRRLPDPRVLEGPRLLAVDVSAGCGFPVLVSQSGAWWSGFPSTACGCVIVAVIF